ncbi:hypothetical protein MCC01971_14530 [Bifidobacteriaceae bacterium MCC01971]|nr:hypothetical protein MCC01971_14530 [Bifidobacteriaceae bacterium MCC01971]
MRGIREVARPAIGKAGPGTFWQHGLQANACVARQCPPTPEECAKAANKDVTSQGISKNQQ